jgi:hypothetical protein
MESMGMPIERTRTDVRRETRLPNGGRERRVVTITVWRVPLPARMVGQLLMVAAGAALYLLGGEQSLDAVVRWLVTASR